MIAATVATLVILAAVLFAESRGQRRLRGALKPLASAGFVLTAWLAGAPSSTFGQIILGALLLSWLGDVLLIGRSKAAFLAGLVAFLLAHLAFLAAFLRLGVEPLTVALAVAVLLVLAAFFYRRIMDRAPARLRGPVICYVLVLVAMAGLAAGTGAPILALAGVIFAASDVSVALDRFTDAGFANRLWGLPAYYAAQLLFAWSLTVLP